MARRDLFGIVILMSSQASLAAPTYWNLYNLEGESQLDSVYITYASLADMLTDSNRTGSFVPNATGASARNVVGSGSDGTTYWNLYNLEGESQLDSVYITYASLNDMLTDSNRTGSFVPNATGASARNVVGSGSNNIPIDVAIDVKPGSDRGCIKIDGRGVLPVGVIGDAYFDVQNINVATLGFAGLAVRIRGNRGALCSLEDINNDQVLDLVCQFDVVPESWDPGDGEATLTGKLYDGTRFKGTDSVCMVP